MFLTSDFSLLPNPNKYLKNPFRFFKPGHFQAKTWSAWKEKNKLSSQSDYFNYYTLLALWNFTGVFHRPFNAERLKITAYKDFKVQESIKIFDALRSLETSCSSAKMMGDHCKYAYTNH